MLFFASLMERKVAKKENKLDFVKEIALAPSEEQAFDGLTVGEAKKVLEKEDAIEYVRYVTHLPESFQRDFVKELVQGYNQVMVSSSTVDPLQAVKLASSLEKWAARKLPHSIATYTPNMSRSSLF